MVQTSPRKRLYQLVKSPARSRIIRTKGAIEKVKTRLNRRNLVSSQKFAHGLDISRSSVQRILKNDLKLQAYKTQNEPILTDKHKAKRLKFRKLGMNRFPKQDTMKTLFSDEKLFDIDEIYNSQNDRICAEADMKGGIRKIKKLCFGLECVLKDFCL